MHAKPKNPELKTKLDNGPQIIGLTPALPKELDPLFELARLAPKLAIDAAMVLLGSDDPQTRKVAVRLGAKVASAQGSKPSRSDALISFMAHMLRGDWAVAHDFMAQAEPAARKLASKVAELLPPERAMELERCYPGYLKSLGAKTLARMPEVCGMLRLAGLIEISKLVDIHCAVAISHYCASSPLPGMIERQADGRDSEPLALLQIKEAQALVAHALGFTARAEQVYSGWSQEFWSAFWKLSTKSEEAAQKASLAAIAISLPTSIDGFSTAPDFATMDTTHLYRFGSLVASALSSPNHETIKRLGARVAAAGESTILDLSALDGRLESHEWILGKSGTPLRWAPVNATARVLFWVGGDVKPYESSMRFARERSSSWLALAEGLMDGGAPAPIFEMAAVAKPRNWDRAIPAQASWPSGQRSCLAPAMFLSKFEHPASHPVFDWLSKHAPDGEIPAIRAWLSAEASTQTNATARHERQAYEAFLDTIELRAATPKANIQKAVSPRL